LQALVRAAKKLAAKQRAAEYAAKQRAVQKLGLYKSKTSTAAKNLTKSKQRAIDKAFSEIQKHTHYAQGKVIRPLQKVIKTTKQGHVIQSYKLSDYFTFTKTKNKPSAQAGIIPTKTGAIVETQQIRAKARIKPDGRVVEIGPKFEITAEGISGVEILELVDAIERGKFKLAEGETLELRSYANLHGRRRRPFTASNLMGLAEDVRAYETIMTEHNFQRWLEYSEVYISREVEQKERIHETEKPKAKKASHH
jgi:hypothetical protein